MKSRLQVCSVQLGPERRSGELGKILSAFLYKAPLVSATPPGGRQTEEAVSVILTCQILSKPQPLNFPLCWTCQARKMAFSLHLVRILNKRRKMIVEALPCERKKGRMFLWLSRSCGLSRPQLGVELFSHSPVHALTKVVKGAHVSWPQEPPSHLR